MTDHSAASLTGSPRAAESNRRYTSIEGDVFPVRQRQKVVWATPARSQTSLMVRPVAVARRSTSAAVRRSDIKAEGTCNFAPSSSAFLHVDALYRACKNAAMGDADQEHARRLIAAIQTETGYTLTRLARIAGLAHTTLTRFMNSDVTWLPSQRTMNKIMNAVARLRMIYPVSLPPEPTRPTGRPKPKLVKPAPAKKGRG